MRARLQSLRAWWQNRLPSADTLRLTQRNVYILPTRAGLAYALTLVVMLLAAVNYQLNLGYALTFLLAGAGIVSMHMTHNTLRGLTLQLRPPRSAFAGESAALELVLDNPGNAPRHGLALRLHGAPADTAVWCDVPACGQQQAQLRLLLPRRGWHDVPALVVETVFPFGLFRAWALWRPAARVLAWPQPEAAPPPLPSASAAAGQQARRQGEGTELDGVRAWRRGDALRQVAWKKVAKSGELVSRETSQSSARELWLAWNDIHAPGSEARLSRLAAWVLAAERQGLACGLRLPGRELPPGLGEGHRRQALDLLGQWA